MTVVEQRVLRPFERVALNGYRDIHKGIRAELFALTTAAGTLDPHDGAGRADLSRHVQSVVELLVAHAEHEDAVIQPVLEAQLPELAAQIATDHPHIEAQVEEIRDLAAAAVDASDAEVRDDVFRVYMELASFTSAYLTHQDFEERDVTPALERAIGIDGVVELHQAIVGSIPPDEMMRTLPLMLTAMNIDDRTEMLGGMQAGAPPEVFAGVWNLTRSVLTPGDTRALAHRLGVV
jgi:hypothetical protein